MIWTNFWLFQAERARIRPNQSCCLLLLILLVILIVLYSFKYIYLQNLKCKQVLENFNKRNQIRVHTKDLLLQNNTGGTRPPEAEANQNAIYIPLVLAPEQDCVSNNSPYGISKNLENAVNSMSVIKRFPHSIL